jgi:hypothetical protein
MYLMIAVPCRRDHLTLYSGISYRLDQCNVQIDPIRMFQADIVYEIGDHDLETDVHVSIGANKG